MPKRTDIHTILIIGSGPIVIGQACEFDYSGVQACKALKEEGFRVVLLNSNPVTIMTDPGLAHATYIEPIIVETVEKIIKAESVDAILPTMGGQTALNLSMTLHRLGILDKYNVKLIGANPDSIEKAEDRKLFRKCMDEINLESPKSYIISETTNLAQIAQELNFPIIIRPSFTLGGTGGGIAYNLEEFKEKVSVGLSASPIKEVLVEESLIGWKEFELEVIRDNKDNCIIICSIENIDPMGIHTGDSITVAPALTLSDKEFQFLRSASIAIIRKIGIETGGANIQFAVNPKNGRVLVIEMNPRVSRSSALASKATGFPIAKIAAKLAVGYTLDELTNDMTLRTAAFEPSIDYIVVKFPRFDFNKFPGAIGVLSTYMQSVGEVISFGRNFAEAFQKGLRSLEIGLDGLTNIDATDSEIYAKLKIPTASRYLWIAEALRRNISISEIHNLTYYDPWFLNQIKEITDIENELKDSSTLDHYLILKAKAMGFSDSRISTLTKNDIAKFRAANSIFPSYRRVDTCAAEFASTISYLYSSYEINASTVKSCEAHPTTKKKIIVIGSGPNRIGQGIEFDYSCVKALQHTKSLGYESIIINCNPETVSTDYSVVDKLYAEPLTIEDILEVIRVEQQNGDLIGVITQIGGQTPLKLTKGLVENNVNILGTNLEVIDALEDRDKFRSLCHNLNIPQPLNYIASNTEELLNAIEALRFPIIIRPSYVIGGNFMKVLRDYNEISETNFNETGPLLVEQFLEDAQEFEIDGISDGKDYVVFALMQHLEPAGIHSGDSSCSISPFDLSEETKNRLLELTDRLIKNINIQGFFNLQFAVDQMQNIYILEANPRASRTLPFVSKSLTIPVIEYGISTILNQALPVIDAIISPKRFFIKRPIFSFHKIPECTPSLGVQMRSTGEIMASGDTLEEAILNSQLSDPYYKTIGSLLRKQI